MKTQTKNKLIMGLMLFGLVNDIKAPRDEGIYHWTVEDPIVLAISGRGHALTNRPTDRQLQVMLNLDIDINENAVGDRPYRAGIPSGDDAVNLFARYMESVGEIRGLNDEDEITPEFMNNFNQLRLTKLQWRAHVNSFSSYMFDIKDEDLGFDSTGSIFVGKEIDLPGSSLESLIYMNDPNASAIRYHVWLEHQGLRMAKAWNDNAELQRIINELSDNYRNKRSPVFLEDCKASGEKLGKTFPGLKHLINRVLEEKRFNPIQMPNYQLVNSFSNFMREKSRAIDEEVDRSGANFVDFELNGFKSLNDYDVAQNANNDIDNFFRDLKTYVYDPFVNEGALPQENDLNGLFARSVNLFGDNRPVMTALSFIANTYHLNRVIVDGYVEFNYFIRKACDYIQRILNRNDYNVINQHEYGWLNILENLVQNFGYDIIEHAIIWISDPYLYNDFYTVLRRGNFLNRFNRARAYLSVENEYQNLLVNLIGVQNIDLGRLDNFGNNLHLIASQDLTRAYNNFIGERSQQNFSRFEIELKRLVVGPDMLAYIQSNGQNRPAYLTPEAARATDALLGRQPAILGNYNPNANPVPPPVPMPQPAMPRGRIPAQRDGREDLIPVRMQNAQPAVALPPVPQQQAAAVPAPQQQPAMAAPQPNPVPAPIVAPQPQPAMPVQQPVPVNPVQPNPVPAAAPAVQPQPVMPQAVPQQPEQRVPAAFPRVNTKDTLPRNNSLQYSLLSHKNNAKKISEEDLKDKLEDIYNSMTGLTSERNIMPVKDTIRLIEKKAQDTNHPALIRAFNKFIKNRDLKSLNNLQAYICRLNGGLEFSPITPLEFSSELRRTLSDISLVNSDADKSFGLRSKKSVRKDSKKLESYLKANDVKKSKIFKDFFRAVVKYYPLPEVLMETFAGKNQGKIKNLKKISKAMSDNEQVRLGMLKAVRLALKNDKHNRSDLVKIAYKLCDIDYPENIDRYLKKRKGLQILDALMADDMRSLLSKEAQF